MRRSVPFMIIQDVLLTGLILCVFAFFHHVQPRLSALGRSQSSPAPTVQTAPEDTPEPVRTEQPEPETWGEKFDAYFSDGLQTGENFYKSPNVSVTVETVEQELNGHFQRWYVADIYVRDISSFSAYVENGSYESYLTTPALELAELAGAIVSINGDYCNAQAQSGFFVRNGTAYQQDQLPRCDIAVLYTDGSLETYAPGEYTAEEILEREPWQLWKFGPELLDENGQPLESFNTSSAIEAANPRSALGYYEPGHYCFVVVDGRQSGYSRGMSLPELAKVFEDLGCTAAYNMDGGHTVFMTKEDQYVNHSYKPSKTISDCICICEPTEEASA